MILKMTRAAAAALLSLACVLPVRADYVGAQAGGGPLITYGAFAPTINGVVMQLTKSVPVDPVTGLAVPLATSTKQPAFGTAGSASPDVSSVQGVLNGVPQNVETVQRSTSADRGGTITAGGTAQQMMAANTARRGFLIQNQSTGDLYVNGLSTAAANQTSLRIPAGALYETSPHHSGTGAVSIFGATTGQAYYAREF